MWCENCQQEVAAEVAADGSVRCGTCGELIPDQQITPPEDPLRSAQELLDRWSKEPLMEPLGRHPGKEASHLEDAQAEESESKSAEDSVEETPVEPVAEVSPEKKPKFRFDAAHVPEEQEEESQPTPSESPAAGKEPAEKEPVPEPVAGQDASEEQPTPELVASVESQFQPRRVDAAQPVAMHAAPHIDIQQLIDERLEQERKGINWLVLGGQWLSYLGVLGLTAGAALIVYGYFGGNPEMTPKGWMLTTAGQMLLLLGIVTLISGGLEQSNDEVNTRIELLGEQMLRFERETKEQLLRGPKIAAAQYGENAKSVDQKSKAEQKESDS